jgi:hypothetical protein
VEERGDGGGGGGGGRGIRLKHIGIPSVANAMICMTVYTTVQAYALIY